MNVQTHFAALIAAGLLIATPVLAQTSPVGKQPTQNLVPSSNQPDTTSAHKQPTQNLVPSPNQAGVDPSYKQKTQSLVPPTNQDAWQAGKQK
jgi:hypothetical protein